MKLSYLIILLLLFTSLSLVEDDAKIDPPFLQKNTPWADSVHASMSLDQKIGQLFSVAAYSNRDKKHEQEIIELIEKYHIGGLTFFQGGPVKQAQLTNIFQSKSAIPLMIAIDGEWGLSMRLDSTVRYPWQMTLGAIQDNNLIYQMGLDVAAQFKRLGVHVNFAPVVDVNNNPKNPVINARSFGENKREVAAKGLAYMKGMQDGGIIANAKHFPGHGDTDADSHVTLPIVKHDKERIDSIELFPFKTLINNGVASMMTAHLYLPAYSKDDKKASSLQSTVVDTVLKQKLGFKGLIFTDGLNMGGVSRYQSSDKNDMDALLAGNDILLLSQDVPAAVEAIKQAIADSLLSIDRINESSLKVLRAKEWLGLNQFKKIETKNLIEDLNHSSYLYHIRKLHQASLTLVRNKTQLLPIKDLHDKKIMALAFTAKDVSCANFHQSLNRYTKVDTLHYENLPVSAQKSLLDTLLNYDQIIVSWHASNASPWKPYQIDNDIKNFLNVLRLKKEIILSIFANTYSLQDFLAAEFAPSLLLAYQNSFDAQDLAGQLIFGAIEAKGKLPVSASKTIKQGQGVEAESTGRLQYVFPEELDINSNELQIIDDIVKEGIAKKAYPGAQVLLAKGGKVFYHKSFGNHKYETIQKVKESDLYDLASVTKISSTLICLMQLQDEGKLSLDDKLGKHLKITNGTPYEDLVIRDMLAHQAGLAAWIPFYNKTVVNGKLRTDIYQNAEKEGFTIPVADNLFMLDKYADTILYRILFRAEVKEKKEYRYSDIAYYLLKEVVEKVRKEDIDTYVADNFYEPLGMSRTTFNPLNKFSLSEIVPTEQDNYFRKQLIHGYVHDPGAAMLGGVGGHAGLFSTANDMAKLMQMLLQGGEYAGKRYLSEAVIDEYTKCQFCKEKHPKNKEENRRAAGFDKPAFHGNPGPTCDCISFDSYGHSGFTGTYAWVDPSLELVYIFLSNRVYPDANNKKLVELNIRTRIQEEINRILKANNETLDTVLNKI